MGNSNEMTIIFDSRPENEGLARVAAAAFCTQLNPTLEEVADLKTAVSEAVTNCIILNIQINCSLFSDTLHPYLMYLALIAMNDTVGYSL